MNDERSLIWKMLFFSIVIGYCLYYAPFGVNETDGGFLTGLAWQVLNGKVLYHDIVYVRPPLPVWLRALELQILPEQFAVLGERWIFYGKVALYSWLGAAVLAQGERRWPLAVFGFVVSAHCYPPMAWHTVDGILFALLAVFFASPGQGQNFTTYKKGAYWAIAGICLFCSLLCKQSFYPLLPLFALFMGLEKEQRWERMGWFLGAFALCIVLFFSYLVQNDLLASFLQMTSGAASGGQALQHGVFDYFRITPELALPSMVLLLPVVWWFWKGKNAGIALLAWSFWLFALVASYAAITWLRQDHTAPFAQSRALFWVAAGFIFWLIARDFNRNRAVGSSFLSAGALAKEGIVFSRRSLGEGAYSFYPPEPSCLPGLGWRERRRASFLLLGISWCAAISWGYNLPMLFATPWVWAGIEVTRVLEAASKSVRFLKSYRFIMLLALLLTFRVAHEFIYRDGRRSEMKEPMGLIFPQLSGIYSDRETVKLYRDLKQLSQRYGPNFKTLPAFPQASFLTNTPPPLPLDWVVNRETNGDNSLIFKDLQEKQPVIFMQKSFREKIDTDPQLEVTRRIFQTGKVVEETPHFWVIKNYEL